MCMNWRMGKLSRSYKPKALAGLAVAVVLAAIAGGCSLLPREEEALQPPLVKPAQENYSTVTVERGTITKQISSVGILQSVAEERAQFAGQGGRIDEIVVRAGDRVKKGDVLVQLLLDGLDLQLKEQELALERAKLARREAQNADADYLRIATLQQEIEQIKYDRLKAQFDSRQLVSSIDGQVVFAESLKEGDIVEPYRTLVTVADPTRLRVSLRVENENDIREAEVGMIARMELNDRKLEGKIVQTPSSAPSTTVKELAERYAKTLYIEAEGLADGGEIGDTVSVTIVTKEKQDVLKIPRSGVRAFLGRTFVRVLEDGSRIREVDVEQGIVASTETEIVKGLEEDQEIILQ